MEAAIHKNKRNATRLKVLLKSSLYLARTYIFMSMAFITVMSFGYSLSELEETKSFVVVILGRLIELVYFLLVQS